MTARFRLQAKTQEHCSRETWKAVNPQAFHPQVKKATCGGCRAARKHAAPLKETQGLQDVAQTKKRRHPRRRQGQVAVELFLATQSSSEEQVTEPGPATPRTPEKRKARSLGPAAVSRCSWMQSNPTSSDRRRIGRNIRRWQQQQQRRQQQRTHSASSSHLAMRLVVDCRSLRYQGDQRPTSPKQRKNRKRVPCTPSAPFEDFPAMPLFLSHCLTFGNSSHIVIPAVVIHTPRICTVLNVL